VVKPFVCPHCSTVMHVEKCPHCGAQLDKAGKCPALCHPPAAPAPKYDGPALIGCTHIGRMARP